MSSGPCRSEKLATFARVIDQLIIWKYRASRYNVRPHKKLLFLGQRLNINRRAALVATLAILSLSFRNRRVSKTKSSSPTSPYLDRNIETWRTKSSGYWWCAPGLESGEMINCAFGLFCCMMKEVTVG